MQVNPRYDVRRLVKRRTDKRGRSLGAFETLRDAKRELRYRVRHLDPTDDVQVAMGSLLMMCTKKYPCESLACPRCARTRRIQNSAKLLKFLVGYPLKTLQFVTLVNPIDAIPAGQLHAFDPRALVNRLRRQLERAGFDKRTCWLVGGIDGEWDAGWQCYQPHVHLITWGVTESQLKALVEFWSSAPHRVRIRKRREPIDDLPRVVTYLHKSWWPAVARKNNPQEIHPHGKRRPANPIQREIMSFFAASHPNDLVIRFGVKSHSDILLRTCSHE